MLRSTWRRFWAKFWALPVVSMLVATALVFLLLTLDHLGVSARLANFSWPLDFSGDTAVETVNTLTSVIVALMALFFSITLIVMTMAASSLGVRLVERWANDRHIRVTLSLLMALLAFALILQAAIDPNGPSERIPRLTILALLAGMVPALSWLAIAFGHLSRRIHIDASIADLGKDLRRDLGQLSRLSARRDERTDWDDARTLSACRSGYIDNIDMRRLIQTARDNGLQIRLPVSQGTYVHRDDCMLIVHGDAGEKIDEEVCRYVRISDYRSTDSKSTFSSALLAEIAARALSPAVNDVYTALGCIDHLGGGMADAFADQNAGGWFGDDRGAVLHIPDLCPKGILERPLDILRHAASDYPSASIRLLGMLERLADHATDSASVVWLKRQAELVANSALVSTHAEKDEAAIREAREEVREAESRPSKLRAAE
ncbi:MAG: DUF2254 family protein [Pacificimonas sp.]